MRFGIRLKAIAAISIMTMVLAFSLMWMSVYHGTSLVREELLRRGNISTNNLAHNAAYATLIEDTTTISDLLGGVMAEEEVVYARIVEPNGTVVAERERAEFMRSSEGSACTNAACHASVPVGELSGACASTAHSQPNRAMVHFHAPIYIRESANDNLDPEYGLYEIPDPSPVETTQRHVIGYAQIGMTTVYSEQAISNMRSNMVWITLLVILLAMLATSAVVRVAVRPLRALVIATGRVAAGDYDSKVDDRRNDEIGDLAVSFNKMTADLKSTRGALVEKELLEVAIIELKDAQQQLVQAGKMAAIGQLAAGVAHEINNPLAGIMGYAQLANEQLRTRAEAGIKPGEIHKFRGYIENMEKQSQRCKQIVQNLLRFARSSTIGETEQVSVNEVLNETLSFISHQTGTIQTKLEAELADNLPVIAGHAGKLQQVFTNIIINAIQAIKDSGTITITSALVDGNVRVVIADTGEGIPSENLEKIFEPFFTTKDIGEGTGLGLSVTYGLIHEMGGQIAVESTVGEGTTFTLTFPLERTPETHPEHLADTQPKDVPDGATLSKDSPSA